MSKDLGPDTPTHSPIDIALMDSAMRSSQLCGQLNREDIGGAQFKELNRRNEMALKISLAALNARQSLAPNPPTPETIPVTVEGNVISVDFTAPRNLPRSS